MRAQHAPPADATVLPNWAGEAVTCLSFSPDGQLLAAGGAAGTVRVWQLQQAADTAPSASRVLVAAHNSTVPAVTSGGAVGAVRWLPTPGGWVLLTGNRNNASLQLWHTAGDAAAAPLEWAPLQALRFEGKDSQDEFYNQLDVVPSQQVGVASLLVCQHRLSGWAAWEVVLTLAGAATCAGPTLPPPFQCSLWSWLTRHARRCTPCTTLVRGVV